MESEGVGRWDTVIGDVETAELGVGVLRSPVEFGGVGLGG